MFNIGLSYDLNLNDGDFFVKLWGMNLVRGGLKRRGRKIYLIRDKNNKKLEIEINEEKLKFLKTLFIEIKNKIKIREIRVNSETGIVNPFYTAYFSSIFSSIILGIFASLKNSQPTASFELKNETNFYDNIFNLKSYYKLSISIFDVIYSIFVALLTTKKRRLLKNF